MKMAMAMMIPTKNATFPMTEEMHTTSVQKLVSF